MFKVQRELLTKYHVKNAQEFYSTQTFWNVPQDPTIEGGLDPNSDTANQPPYYVYAQAPGQDKPTFQITSALTPLARQYLAAWMTVSSDPEDYGKMTVLKLPTGGGQQLEGPVQVQNAFQSNPKFTQDRTLLGNQSVDIIYGNLLTLPVAGGFLYVEPVYIQQRTPRAIRSSPGCWCRSVAGSESPRPSTRHWTRCSVREPVRRPPDPRRKKPVVTAAVMTSNSRHRLRRTSSASPTNRRRRRRTAGTATWTKRWPISGPRCGS